MLPTQLHAERRIGKGQTILDVAAVAHGNFPLCLVIITAPGAPDAREPRLARSPAAAKMDISPTGTKPLLIPGRRYPIMWRATGLLFAAYQLIVCSGAVAAEGSPHGRIVGYATGWGATQDRAAAKIATLIFAFAKLSDGRVVIDAAGQEQLQQLTRLKATHPALRVTISVGGWGAGGFSEAAGSDAGRRAFADSAAQLVAARDADGLDVDWEYPEHDESGIRASP